MTASDSSTHRPQRRAAADPAGRLAAGLAALELRLDEAQQALLMRYVDELVRWNAAYNLTAVRDPADMVTRHLLDSLAALPVVDAAMAACRVPMLLDVGAGAGLPSIPVAIARPGWRVVALDSNGKKARFLRHVQRTLALDNLSVIEGRCEDLRPEPLFELIISRAFASLADFVCLTDGLAAPEAHWLAMKGRPDNAEREALPPDWRIEHTVSLQVPGLDESRQVLVLARRPS